MKKIDLKYVISFLVGITSGSLTLYLPVFAQNLGASFTVIGALGGINALTSGISYYYFGRFSDLRAIRKILIVSGLFFMFIIGALHYFAHSLASLFALRAIMGIAAGLYAGPMVAYSSDSIKTTLRDGVSKYLAWGALGWGIGNILAGYGANFFSYNMIFFLSSVPFLLAFIVALMIEQQNILPVKVPFLPLGLIRKNLRVYLSFFIRHTSAQAVWAVFVIYILSLGGNHTLVAAIFGINQITQFFVLSYIPRMKSSSAMLVKYGLALSTFAFFTMVFVPNAYFLLFSMAIIGFAWSFLYGGVNLYLLERNPEKATVTGLVQSTISMSMLVGPLVGGILSDLFGIKEMILIMSVVSLFALIAEMLVKDK